MDVSVILRDAARDLATVLDRAWTNLPWAAEVKAEAWSAKDQKLHSSLLAYTFAGAESAHAWLRLAEDFVATQIVAFLGEVFAQLRGLLTFVTASLLLLLFAVSSYPFRPQRLMTLYLWSVTLAVALGSLVIFVQMNRNDLLSRIAGTEPRRLTFDRGFLLNVGTYAVIPILGLLATVVPGVGGLSSALQGVLRVFR
jgi:hypothetical protein